MLIDFSCHALECISNSCIYCARDIFFHTIFLKKGSENGSWSFHEFPQELLLCVHKYQKWETTKGYQWTDNQGRSTPSFVLGINSVSLPCRAQVLVWHKGEYKVKATTLLPDSRIPTDLHRYEARNSPAVAESRR